MGRAHLFSCLLLKNIVEKNGEMYLPEFAQAIFYF